MYGFIGKQVLKQGSKYLGKGADDVAKHGDDVAKHGDEVAEAGSRAITGKGLGKAALDTRTWKAGAATAVFGKYGDDIMNAVEWLGDVKTSVGDFLFDEDGSLSKAGYAAAGVAALGAGKIGYDKMTGPDTPQMAPMGYTQDGQAIYAQPPQLSNMNQSAQMGELPEQDNDIPFVPFA